MATTATDGRGAGSFVPAGFDPPETLEGDGFRLEPLGPQHNERDYRAWTSSTDYIRTLPGFGDSDWPTHMPLEANLADLEAHARDFRNCTGFTYSILDGDEVIGCVYIYPTTSAEHDAQITSWVTNERAPMDASVRETIRSWIDTAWPFANPYVP